MLSEFVWWMVGSTVGTHNFFLFSPDRLFLYAYMRCVLRVNIDFDYDTDFYIIFLVLLTSLSMASFRLLHAYMNSQERTYTHKDADQWDCCCFCVYVVDKLLNCLLLNCNAVDNGVTIVLAFKL